MAHGGVNARAERVRTMKRRLAPCGKVGDRILSESPATTGARAVDGADEP